MEIADRTAQVLALVLERSPRTVDELAGGEEAVEALVRHGLLEWDAARAAVRPGPALVRYARSGQDRQELTAKPARRAVVLQDEHTGGRPNRLGKPRHVEDVQPRRVDDRQRHSLFG